MKWYIEDNLIKCNNEGNITVPMAADIFRVMPSDLGLNYSKILALNYIIEFYCEKDSIQIKVFAIKGKEKYPLSVFAGKFLDYIVINSTCYYINQSIQVLNECIENKRINISLPLNFFEYINLKKELDYYKINYSDNVMRFINSLRTDETSKYNPNFHGVLFPYQESGVKWLNFMVDGQCGCILADSMGLGKTLQIILVLGHLKETCSNSHSLIICPITILENWKREIEKFYPSLKCRINYGDANTSYYKELLDYDVIITAYSSVQSNFSAYEMIDWNLIVVDEAQNIKNPFAKRTVTIKELNKDVGIAVSGTPFENHITDVWSIVDFVLPGYLGSLSDFKSNYEDDVASAVNLEKKISPIMIRRKVEDVAKDLPERIDIPQPLKMTIDEAKCYDAQLRSFDELKTMRLDKIQSLRMFCTHPSVYDDVYIGQDPILLSKKYERCCEILEEIVENDEKAIIFTSFNKMIDLLVDDISKRFGIYTDYINGAIDAKERQSIIDRFSEVRGAAVLVLNPKAAGAGLNITAANHVIHYNLEWNPAIEDQASARAYRRGQNKTVFVHRLYYLDTIEEIINEKIENKRYLSEKAIIGNDGSLNDEYLAKALAKTPIKR